MPAEAWESLTKALCALSGWPRDLAEETLTSVLCALDQSLFSNGRTGGEPLAAAFRVLRRCRHHRGTRPKKLGRHELVHMVATDLDLDSREAEERIRKVLEALEYKLSPGEKLQLKTWLPEEMWALWPTSKTEIVHF